MLGVIGGMGPLASADFFRKLIDATPAACDEDHIPVLIHSVPQHPSRPAAILRNGASPLPALMTARDRLVAAGATMLAMPCNTAHYWHAELAANSVPFPHIADAVAFELPPQATHVGIIATAATLAARIYDQRLDPRIEWLAPDAHTFERPVVAELLERGAACVVLACTEVPVALDAIASPLRVHCVDSTASLARSCVRLWRENAARSDRPDTLPNL
jgi:aspartate racemase